MNDYQNNLDEVPFVVDVTTIVPEGEGEAAPEEATVAEGDSDTGGVVFIQEDHTDHVI